MKMKTHGLEGWVWVCGLVFLVSFCIPYFGLMSGKAGDFSIKREGDYMCVFCVCVFVKVSCWYESRTRNNYVANWI